MPDPLVPNYRTGWRYSNITDSSIDSSNRSADHRRNGGAGATDYKGVAAPQLGGGRSCGRGRSAGGSYIVGGGAVTAMPVCGSPAICTLCLGMKFGQGAMPARIFFNSSVS